MQNNHDWICIEFACLYLANIEHSAIISPGLFGFTFWYNITDHDLLCIEFACLYLYIKKWSLITKVISWVKLWLLARYKHSNSMDGTAWLFCIKRWSLIITVIYWVKFRLFASNSMDGTTWLFCIKKWSLITTVIYWFKLWLFARYKYKNSMDDTTWLFCIKKWILYQCRILTLRYKLSSSAMPWYTITAFCCAKYESIKMVNVISSTIKRTTDVGGIMEGDNVS